MQPPSPPRTRTVSGRRIAAALLAGAAAAVLTGTRPAAAGIEIATRAVSVEEGASPAEAGRGHLWIDGSRIRIDAPGREGPPWTLLFRSGPDGHELVLVDHGDRTLVTLDGEQLELAASQAAVARRESAERWARVPPEQREVLERMAGGTLAPPQPAPPLRLEPAPGRKLERGLPARRSRLVRGDAEVGELWSVAWRDAGVARSELVAFRTLARVSRAWAEALGSASPLERSPHPLELFALLEGFPVRITRLRDGVRVAETELELPVRRDLPPDWFLPPAGYSARGAGEAVRGTAH